MHEVRLDGRQAPAGFSVHLANGTVVTSEGRATGVL